MADNESLFEQLGKLRNSKTTIVGIGNTLKGDDDAGPAVCELLGRDKVAAVVINAGSVPENYIQPIIRSNPEALLVIDAIDFGAKAGTVKVFRPEHLQSFVISTHTLSPDLFVKMVQQNIAVDVYFIGIQPKQVQLGQSLSAEVSQATRQIAVTLRKIFPL